MSCWDTDFRLMLFVSLRIEDYNNYQGWAQLKIIRVTINYENAYIYIHTCVSICVCIYIDIYTYTYNFVKWTIALFR